MPSEHWDRVESAKLRQHGLTQEQIGAVIGIIAEHRMIADLVGYKRGYEKGKESTTSQPYEKPANPQ